MAYTFKRDYERAVVVGLRVVKSVPEFINGYKPLIASLGHLGRREEAAPYIQKLLSLERDFTIEKFRRGYPFKLDRDRDNYCEGLELAGVSQRVRTGPRSGGELVASGARPAAAGLASPLRAASTMSNAISMPAWSRPTTCAGTTRAKRRGSRARET